METINTPDAFASIVKKLDSTARYVSHRPLTGGVSAEIHAVKYQTVDLAEVEVVVRRHGDADWKAQGDAVASNEYALHKALHLAGVPVPDALLHDATGDILPSPYLVISMIDGDMIIDESWLPGALEQMAEFLLTLHSLDVNSMALPAGLRRDEDPVAGALHYIPETEFELREAVSAWQVVTNKPTLLHGDYWPNNVLWKNQRIAAVIDWEDAAVGTPVVDLAGVRSELIAMFDEAAMETFTEHYLKGTSADLSDLPLWEVFSSFAALATMGEWGLDPEVEAVRRERTEKFAQRAKAEVLARR